MDAKQPVAGSKSGGAAKVSGPPKSKAKPKSNKPKPVEQPSDARRSYGVVAFRIVPASVVAADAKSGAASAEPRIEYFLIQHNGGHWSFPKGRPDFDTESNDETARREFTEESGLPLEHLTVFDACGWFREEYTFMRKSGVQQKVSSYRIGGYTYAESHRVSIEPAEIQNYGWFDKAGSIQRCTFPQSKQLIRDVSQVVERLVQQKLNPTAATATAAGGAAVTTNSTTSAASTAASKK